jgi:hypothetical protein
MSNLDGFLVHFSRRLCRIFDFFLVLCDSCICYYYHDGMVQTLNPQDTVTPSLEPGRE